MLNKDIQKIYDEFWNSSWKSILNNNIEIDPHLSDIKNDKRMGLSLIIPVSGHCLDNFQEIINQLRTIEPGQYYLPSTDIHVTVLTITTAYENFVFDKRQAQDYKIIFDKILRNVRRFEIEFEGLSATKSVVMIRGFANKIQDIRDKLKNEIKNCGLDVSERQSHGLVHSTIVRFKQKLQNPRLFVKKIEEFRDLDFGKFEAKRIIFVLHDWYNLKEKRTILAEYELK